MMAEYTTLTSYLEALVSEKEAYANADVNAIVDERLAQKRAEVKAEVEKEIAQNSLIAEAKICAITDAIAILTRPTEVAEEVVEENEDEVSEVISDETY
jgi:hypothetical protein